MRSLSVLCFLALGATAVTAVGADESLSYSVHWPTGVKMGKGELRILQNGSRAEFEFDASVPGVPVVGNFGSRVDKAGCTNEFTKKYELGFRKSGERTTVDGVKARRETSQGGKSVMTIGECGKDALAFLQQLRAELAAGKKPASQKILFGAEYQLTMTYPKGTDANVETVAVNVKGPASQNQIEIDFKRDAGRTPLRVRVPLMMGKFVLELNQ